MFWGGISAAWRRAAAATVAGAVLGLAGVAPAIAADPVVGRPGASGSYGKVTLEGFDHPVEVGGLNLTINGHKVPAYCIDLHHPVAIGADYREGDWTAADVDNLDLIQWVLLNGYPQADGADLIRKASADAAGIAPDRLAELLYVATQVSVWHFSDGAKLTGASADARRRHRGYSFRGGEFPLVQKVYTYLTTHATKVAEPRTTLSLSPSTATAEAGKKAGPFTVAGPSGEIALSVTGGHAVDADGGAVTKVTNGSKFWLVRDGAGEVRATATAEATHSTGRVFLYAGNERRQKLILAGTVGDRLTADVRATFTAGTPTTRPTPTPTPTATATPTSTPTPTDTEATTTPTPAPGQGGGTDGSGTLPRTGSATMIVVGLGLLLLAVGGAAVVLVRRRRVSFTA